jgi:hypothetical protein
VTRWTPEVAKRTPSQAHHGMLDGFLRHQKGADGRRQTQQQAEKQADIRCVIQEQVVAIPVMLPVCVLSRSAVM